MGRLFVAAMLLVSGCGDKDAGLPGNTGTAADDGGGGDGGTDRSTERGADSWTDSAPWLQVSAGADHTCAVHAEDEAVTCGGSDEYGPVSGVSSRVALSAVSAGSGHACGLRPEDNPATCWRIYVWTPC